MHISIETSEATESRLRRVIRAAELTVFEEPYAFGEVSASQRPPFSSDALAYVRDDDVWSCLRPSASSTEERCRVFRFHFPSDLDNSGFVGWLASHLKRTCGTGVFVVCGSNSARGGIFDYWGCPVDIGEAVIAEVRRLREAAS